MHDTPYSTAAETMIRDAHCFYEHGWLLGTSGNLSVRLDDTNFLITASGRDKGRLTPDDFLAREIARPGERGANSSAYPTDPSLKPSAEECIHQAIYARVPGVGAVYHVHEPYSAFCSERDANLGSTRMSSAEMIKGLGIWEANPRVRIPIFANHADVPAIAAEVDAHLSDPANHKIPGVNIRNHGYYAWGSTPFEAKRHVETFAYLFRYSWELGNGA
ncbi:methylthioribulose 1-phosphate dehydratase [Bradymonas sediminis]|nr:methylthioribulose 1-phosphate dehydratase [Bradymonas sediminis]TDP62169.1 methylthioribulose-1-phosphate dehydratase [Bradymonas sediminis]